MPANRCRCGHGCGYPNCQHDVLRRLRPIGQRAVAATPRGARHSRVAPDQRPSLPTLKTKIDSADFHNIPGVLATFHLANSLAPTDGFEHQPQDRNIAFAQAVPAHRPHSIAWSSVSSKFYSARQQLRGWASYCCIASDAVPGKLPSIRMWVPAEITGASPVRAAPQDAESGVAMPAFYWSAAPLARASFQCRICRQSLTIIDHHNHRRPCPCPNRAPSIRCWPSTAKAT